MKIPLPILGLMLLPSLMSGQSLTIVASGGDAGPTSGTNWSIDGTVLTVSGTASINAAVINTQLQSGSLTIKGNTSTFAVTISGGITNTTHSGSVFTIGESGNSGNISITAAISNAGPISVYGGVIDINGNITSSSDGDIFLKSISAVNNDILLHSGKSITKSGGNGTLTMQAHRRVACQGSITNTGTGKLNVILWSDYDNNNDGGSSADGSITTNGGHVWIGGSSSNGGTYTWKNLTVGDGPSVGAAGSNLIDVNLFGNVTTGGGDFLAWAGNGGSTIAGIGTNGSNNLVDAGSGNITLITDRVKSNNASVTAPIRFKTTGTFTLAPYDGSFPGSPSIFTWNPSVVNGTDLLFPTGDFERLEIVNYASLGGLTIGRYAGMSSGSPSTPVVLTNSSKIQVSSSTSITAPVAFHCGDFTSDATFTATGSTLSVDATGAVTLNAALSGSNTTVTVKGNLKTTGSLTNVNLTGGNAQSITGTASITNLTLNKTAGTTATVTEGPQNVTGELTLTAGTLAAGGHLTLKSTSSGTARVAEHGTGTGTISGNVTVERYIDVNNRPKQWRTIGFPYSGDVTLSTVTGFAVDYTSTSLSVMYYNEGADDGRYGSGTGVRNAGYVSVTGSSVPIPAGRGLMAWIYGSSGTASSGTMSGNLTVSSSGALNEGGGGITLPVSYSTTNTNRGWNLVSNPFASAIDWTHAGITKTNIDNAIYRWDPASASWTVWSGGVSTPSGMNAIVESGGAFFVKANAAGPSLIMPQTAKTSSSSNFAHFSRAPGRLELPQERVRTVDALRLAGVRLSVSGQGNPLPNEAYLDLSRPDATAGFEGRYDAESMGRSSGAGVSIRDGQDMGYAIQFDAPIAETGKEKRYYPIHVTTPAKGATTLELWTEGAWNPLNSVSLIDRKEGRTLLMQGGRLSYAFTMDELKSADRFQLAVNHVKVDDGGKVPGFEVRLLGNPVKDDRIELLLTHPSAQPKSWSVMDNTGRTVGTGGFGSGKSDVQHRVTVPGMRQPGVYVLKVEMDNGDERSIQVVRN